jgi:hypothetical protein
MDIVILIWSAMLQNLTGIYTIIYGMGDIAYWALS